MGVRARFSTCAEEGEQEVRADGEEILSLVSDGKGGG